MEPIPKPTLLSSDLEANDSDSESLTLSRLVYSIFSEVWKEYWKWDRQYSHDALQSLSFSNTPYVHRQDDLSKLLCTSSTPPSSTRDERFDKGTRDQDFVTVYSRNHNFSVSRVEFLSEHTIVADSTFEQHKPYESCSPLSRTVFKGDDADKMAFIPYVDDEHFDFLDHTLCYESFAWQNTKESNDIDTITLETAYRLHNEHSLAYADIDNTRVLPRRLLSTPKKTGLFALSHRRDIPQWSKNQAQYYDSFPQQPMPAAGDLRGRLQSLQGLFCPNLNCIQVLCPVHMELEPPLQIKTPKTPLLDILSQVENPCSPLCFIHAADVESHPSWTEEDIANFNTILEIMPDSPPCHFAIMCYKPCREVLHYLKLMSSTATKTLEVSEIGKGKSPVPIFRDHDADDFTPNEPCRHAGLCNINSQCPCFQNKSHCLRSCQCSMECARRWRGCRCGTTKGGNSCASDRCPCVVVRRECDPELCRSCKCSEAIVTWLSRDSTSSRCRNAQIQHGVQKDVEIKNSRWGLGAFLKEPAKRGDLISEYVGELIYEASFDSRGQVEVAEHRGRSYAFGLNSTLSLDSSYLGNTSRFIDHARSSTSRDLHPNCRAYVRLVNGEHRIGIFAVEDINSGAEIFIDYGTAFYKNEGNTPENT
ncbi:SET domain-containing protein [Hygrophoropsis aurantiaca]|uniref:SET domain-containing protein n=1 Tax=Hygrophoropsis aurantiaca TaxID=72124 RepID=A0ACB8AK27_9AGAM|nr:SET domain-containing protein [Hygrophoropsis aurantiaca]